MIEVNASLSKDQAVVQLQVEEDLGQVDDSGHSQHWVLGVHLETKHPIFIHSGQKQLAQGKQSLILFGIEYSLDVIVLILATFDGQLSI